MAIRSLNNFLKLRRVVTDARRRWLNAVRGCAIDPTASISLSSRLISRVPGGIAVGAESLIAFKTLLYTLDDSTGEHRPIVIGKRCFIGGSAMILPGVVIGDESIVGAGAVVMEDVPPRTIVGGNPARVLRSDIVVGKFGRLAGADDNSRRLWR